MVEVPHPHRPVPNVDELDKVNFITNYFLQGCVPPFWLFIELAKPATDKLWVLILGIDWQDILKDWLRPGTPRRRSAARKGRKRRGLPELDPNAHLGSRPRQSVGEYPGLDLPGGRAVFHIWDRVDLVNYSAAVLEGMTDIGYEALLGILALDPENCPDFAYFTAHADEPQDMVGVAPPQLPLSLTHKDNGQLFEGPEPFVATTWVGPWTFAGSATISTNTVGGAQNVRLTIRSAARGIIAESYSANLIQGESIELGVSADCLPGEFCWMARSVDFGSLQFTFKRGLGFATKNLF